MSKWDHLRHKINSDMVEVKALPSPWDHCSANRVTRNSANIKEWATVITSDDRSVTRKVSKVPKKIADDVDGVVFLTWEDFHMLNIEPGDDVLLHKSELEIEMP